MYRYVLFEDVQRFMPENKDDSISFYDAFQAALRDGPRYSEQLIYPDFSSWDCRDADSLFDLFGKLPISDNSVGDRPTRMSYQDRNYTYFNLQRTFQLSPLIHFESVFYNTDWFSVFYVLDGDAELDFGDETLYLEGGSICIVAPHVSHCFYGKSNCTAINFMIWEKQFPAVFSRILEHRNSLTDYYAQFVSGSGSRTLQFQIADNLQLYYIIRNILTEYYASREYSEEICTSLLEIFLIYSVRESTGSMRRKGRAKEHSLYIPDLLTYIHNNYPSASLEQASGLFGYDSGYISKQLRKYTGKSFQTLLTEERMREAKYMLTYTDMSMADISERLGYSSFAAFSRRFKASEGMAPGKYRKTVKQNSMVFRK